MREHAPRGPTAVATGGRVVFERAHWREIAVGPPGRGRVTETKQTVIDQLVACGRYFGDGFVTPSRVVRFVYVSLSVDPRRPAQTRAEPRADPRRQTRADRRGGYDFASLRTMRIKSIRDGQNAT